MPTTAALTGLLPRRRQRAARAADDSDDEHVDISGLGDDDDELTHLDVRTRRRPARGAAARAKAVAANATASNKRSADGKQNAGDTRRVGTRKSTRTYGRLSDKENEEEEAEPEAAADAEGAEDNENEEDLPISEDSQMLVERVGEELKRATRKFQEVDKWSLEYENVIPTSSPGGAR